MSGSEWSETQSDVTEELGSVQQLVVRPRCVVPRAQPSAVNRSDQRVPVYWDQTVPVWHDAGAGCKRKKSSSAGEMSCRDAESGPGDARRGDGGASASSTTAAVPEVSFDTIMSMYESSLVENSFTRRVLSPRTGSRSLQPRRDDRPRLRRVRQRRQFALISASDLGESEVQSLRAAIERTTICDDRNSHFSHHCNVILLERRRSRSWQDPLSFPHRTPGNVAEAGA